MDAKNPATGARIHVLKNAEIPVGEIVQVGVLVDVPAVLEIVQVGVLVGVLVVLEAVQGVAVHPVDGPVVLVVKVRVQMNAKVAAHHAVATVAHIVVTIVVRDVGDAITFVMGSVEMTV